MERLICMAVVLARTVPLETLELAAARAQFATAEQMDAWLTSPLADYARQVLEPLMEEPPNAHA